jgi:hypothetical protein
MLMMDTCALAGRDAESSGEEQPLPTRFTNELERTPLERNAFLFRNNLGSASDLSRFHPLPSQIPFLLDMFAENVNNFLQVVHMPTVTKMVRSLRGSNPRRLTASEEALMFAIYYAAINSMDETDVSLWVKEILEYLLNPYVVIDCRQLWLVSNGPQSQVSTRT